MPISGLVFALTLCGADAPAFASEPIFPPEEKHNHASCIVELQNGDLLVAWYRGSGERKADDVQILGSRQKRGSTTWEPRFQMADTPGYPDCNPALFAPPNGSIWLFWPTILDHRWEGALLKFQQAADGGDAGAPDWTSAGVVHITPENFGQAMEEASKSIEGLVLSIAETYFDKIRERSRDELYQRLGWMPRVHPAILPSGRWILPLYTDTFSCSIMALSDDQGKTWQTGKPMIGFGNIQPSLVRRQDGTLVAFMRENGPRRKIRLSESRDDGVTWSKVTDSTLPNPGAGVEAIRLQNGHWAIIYNDTTGGRHSLAISLSEDEGKTWPITRHVERTKPGDDAFHYPSIIQANDGFIHITYTKRTAAGATIEHARLNEAWIRQDRAE